MRFPWPAVTLMFAPGWYLSGNINVSGNSGDANLAVPLNGSRLRGTLYVVAEKSGGVWTYTTLRVLVEGNQVPIELLPSSPRKDK